MIQKIKTFLKQDKYNQSISIIMTLTAIVYLIFYRSEENKMLLPTFIALLGWIINNYFKISNDIKNKKRELVIKNLSECYFDIKDIYYTTKDNINITNDVQIEFENKSRNILTKLELYSEDKHLKEFKKLLNSISFSNPYNISDCLDPLRMELRKELNLNETNEDIKFLPRIPK